MRQRVLTAALLIPPVLLAVFIDHIGPIYAVALIAYGIGALELARMANPGKPAAGISGLLLLAASPLLITHFFHNDGAPSGVEGVAYAIRLLTVGSVLLSLAGSGMALAVARGARGILPVELGSWWIAGGLLALLALHGWTSNGTTYWSIPAGFRWASPVLLALVPIWIGDTLAIFVGRAFGKHLLVPKISPKKTVEGAVANLLGCLLGAVGLAYLIHQPMPVGIFVGLTAGILGQAGDLLESALKRSAGVKDSGKLLPGHGGLLDRIDSILLSAPFVALIVATLGN
ncbi:MAG TPA: phosphatidate cytidylyltransferase [Fimbriimonadaceae bacterium]|nr:phosphatidate cytidylyltransferase [Fimbriimonadaceae bacterium]